MSTFERCQHCGKLTAVETVTIPATEYQRLLAASAQAARLVITPTTAELLRDMRLRPRLSPPNKLLGDEEVATFLIDNIGKMSKAELVEAAQKHFGPDRCPSAGQIYRFDKAVRAQLEDISGQHL